MPRNGASAAPLTIAANPVEMISASKTIVPICLMVGKIS